VASAPHRRSPRREGAPERAPAGPERERGAAALHLAEPADPGHERLLAEYDAVMELALTELEGAFVDAEGDWAERMHAALARLLGLAAANPELAYLCTVDIVATGQEGLDRRDRWLQRFMGLCEAAYAQSEMPGPPTALQSNVVAGAVFELIRSHAAEDRLDRLPDALPTATLIAISPIVGRDVALRIAG
jgi:hypothetical protein